MSRFFPKPYSQESITLRLPCELLETIEHYAFDSDMSRTAFINRCVEFAISEIESEGELQ